MYCSNCGKQIKNDSKFCNFCGAKVPDTILNDFSKGNINDKEDELVKKTKIKECINYQTNGSDILVTDVHKLNDEVNNSKNKIKFKAKLILFFIIFGIILGVIIGNLGYKAYKNSIENIVPNHYLSFGSRRTWTDQTTFKRKFNIDVTSKVELYELSIDVYVYDFGRLVHTFNHTQKIELGTSTTKVEIVFEKQEYCNLNYDFTFYGVGKTHEKLPDVDYASVYFMNYDNTIYETFIVEKKYGDVWKLPDDPTRKGYIFEGWYYDKNYSRKFEITEQYWRDEGQDLKLYPKWIEV